MGLIKRLKRIYHSLYLHDPSLDKQFTEQSHHSVITYKKGIYEQIGLYQSSIFISLIISLPSQYQLMMNFNNTLTRKREERHQKQLFFIYKKQQRIIFFYIEAIFSCVRLGLAMDMDSPLQVAQLIGGIVMSLLSVLFAYFLSSKKFQYYSLIYKVSHILLYMFNMDKLYNRLTENKQGNLGATLYFFIFGQVSTITFLLKLDSLWLEIASSIGQTVVVIVLAYFDIFQTMIIILTFLQFSIFQIINIFKAQKKFLLKLNDKAWLSITDQFYQIPIVITRFDNITQYISLSDCNKTSEKFFDFTGDQQDSEKLNKRMGLFILDDFSSGENPLDGNISQNIGKGPNKNINFTPQQNAQNAYYQTQKDLKSYLIKKSSSIMSQKNGTIINEESNQVEILSCTYNNQSFEVQILPVIIDFQLSIALQFHQVADNQISLTYEKRLTKGLDKSHFNLNLTNTYGGFSSPKHIKRESFSRNGFNNNNKRINSITTFNAQQHLQQNANNQNTPYLNSQMPSNNNFQFLNDEREEEVIQIISFYQNIIKMINSNIDDLIATIEYTCSQTQTKFLQLQIQGLKQLKLEQKLLLDALNLRATYIKSQFQNSQNPINIMSISNQITQLSAPIIQYHYFDFSEISTSIKHHLFIHGYDYYFNVKSIMPQQYQIYSNKELILYIIQSCVFIIADSSKLKSMHQQQQNLMRTFTSSGVPIPHNIVTQNVNNIINTLNNSQQQTINPSSTSTNYHMHKMIQIEFNQVICSNSASNISVKIVNIQQPNLLDQQKHSKLSSFFFNILRLYLEKVGIPASLSYKQNDDNLRYQLTFTILSDCNSLQIQQQQLTQQYLNQANMSSYRQTRVSEYVTNNAKNINNTINLKEKVSPNMENIIESDNLDKPNNNNLQQPQINLLKCKSNEPNQIQSNDFNEPLSNNEQIDLNNYGEESERLEVENEYQNDDVRYNKNGITGIGSGALFLIENNSNKNSVQNQFINNKMQVSKKAFGPKSNLNNKYD